MKKNELVILPTTSSTPAPAASSTPAPATGVEAIKEAFGVQDTESIPLDLTFNGLPYRYIVKKYLEKMNNGQDPTEGKRNELTFDLAMNLRKLTGCDIALLDSIIPCYNGYTYQEKMSDIKSAVRRADRPMSAVMTQCLRELQAEYVDDAKISAVLGDVDDENDLFYIRQVPENAIPPVMKKTFETLAPKHQFQALIAITPMISTLATGIRLMQHQKMDPMNILVYLIGKASSGKSMMDDLKNAWMKRLEDADSQALEEEKMYERLPAKQREKKAKPVVVRRMLAAHTSISKMLERLDKLNGIHALIYTPELDILTANKGKSWGDQSAIDRCAYDGTEYKQDYKDNSNSANIRHVMYNKCLCGTPDALYRSQPNSTNGEITRIAIVTMADNTFKPYQGRFFIPDDVNLQIQEVALVLEHMTGNLDIPQLEEWCDLHLEDDRKLCLKTQDEAKDDLRKRIPLTAMRIVCCLLLVEYAEYLLRSIDHSSDAERPEWAGGCASAVEFLERNPKAVEEHISEFCTEDYHKLYDLIATYLLDNLLFFFRDRVVASKNKSKNGVSTHRASSKKYDYVFNALPTEFTLNDAMKASALDDSGKNRDIIKSQIRYWIKDGLAVKKNGIRDCNVKCQPAVY